MKASDPIVLDEDLFQSRNLIQEGIIKEVAFGLNTHKRAEDQNILYNGLICDRLIARLAMISFNNSIVNKHTFGVRPTE
jgi:primosomal protein N''